MCRSRRPSLISSKRPQRVPWWQGKKRPEGVYWSQNSLADGGIRPGGGLRGAPNAPTKPPRLPEGPSGKSERQLAEQLPRSSLVAHSETAAVEGHAGLVLKIRLVFTDGDWITRVDRPTRAAAPV